ncbi:hypothetical protein [uncultured Acinetobacter sp.]|uniref:hypothetical protein n=1 Tax=uncultured Acinetobacter sp. TaxID=165433 RepID=UPI0025FCF252|nr:hypothetical protein [uncultured Acinetobacter sp.]
MLVNTNSPRKSSFNKFSIKANETTQHPRGNDQKPQPAPESTPNVETPDEKKSDQKESPTQ